jgi:hypothetical protein
MTRRNLAMCAGVLLVGCASQSDFLDSKQSVAVDTAMSRAKFEMNCPAAWVLVGSVCGSGSRGKQATESLSPSGSPTSIVLKGSYLPLP